MVLRRVDPRAIQDHDGDYWVGLTPQHYENLGKNMTDILAHIKQRKAIAAHHKHCIDRHNDNIEQEAQSP